MKTMNGGRALRLGLLASAMAGGLLAHGAALAQSTGSTTAESIIVTAHRQPSVGGLAVQVQTAKDQAVVTSEFIKTQVGSQNFGQLINMLPGVNYSSEDPTGILSTDFRIHGFDGAHISFTIDGTPVNDTGNYAIYPGEYLVGESIDHITVNMGQTEIDSPTASAIGGTVNVVSKLPSTTPQTTVKLTGGSYDYGRVFGEYDTGALGPTGVRSYASVNYVDANKYKGSGDITRWGVDGRVYQPLKNDDFLSVAFTYTEDRPYFYESSTLAQYAQYGNSLDFNRQWAAPVVTPGAAVAIPNPGTIPGFEQGNDSYYYKLHDNPVNFGDIRAQSRFDLGHDVTVTVDPYFFYTLANGGGTQVVNGTNDGRLFGSAARPNCGGTGYDLFGTGKCTSNELFYAPSDTQTHRLGVNSSVIWDLNPENRFQLAYTLDYGKHSQTGEFTTINQATGDPANLFGGLPGNGPQVRALDGTPLRSRDRLSLAKLNQVALNYIGKFDDNRLHVNIGVRDPYFERDLNQHCYTFNGSSAWCDSVNEALVVAAYNADGKGTPGTEAVNLTTVLGTTNTSTGAVSPIKYGANGLPNFRFPFKEAYHFNKILPNAGSSFEVDDHDQVYVSFSEGFSAPKTDDLYTSTQELVQPETTYNIQTGYRYHAAAITASASLWGTKWNNHIVTAYDPTDPTISIDRNVGTVDLYGLDAELGWRATEQLSFYVSGTLEKSRLEDNYDVPVSSGPDAGKSIALPVAGKELVMTPDQMMAVRGQYKVGDWTFGVDGKYTGRRFTDDINSTAMGGFIVADLDAEYRFTVAGAKSAIQFNLYNMFGQNYFSRVSTVSNSTAVVYANGDKVNAASTYLYTGAPPTAYVTLKTSF
jgi:iron complex outermembrane receptor protein